MGPGERRRSAFVAVLALVLLASAPMVSAVSYDRPQATVYTVDVDEGGDATWTIELRYQLVDEEDVGAFESIRNDFEEGNLSVFEGIEGDLSSFAEEASEATGREMSVSDFQRDVYIRDTVTQTVGVVSVDFVWSGFAEASPSEVRVGDVFVGSGLALTENERFIIENVEGLPVRNVSPQPDTSDGERLIWDGERFFEEGQPSVLFSEESSGTGDGNGSDGEGSPQGSGSSTPVALMAGFVALVSGFAGGLYLGRKKGIVGETAEEEETTEDEKRTETQKELLTDEDRVVRILKEEGGKMKQAEIVDRTDWSKSKVSMLLSNMEDEGTISKLRLGRENVIELEPDE